MPQEIPLDMFRQAASELEGEKKKPTSAGRGGTPSSGAGRGSVIPSDMFHQAAGELKAEEKKQRVEGLKREAKGVAAPFIRFGKEAATGAAGGPPSTLLHIGDAERAAIEKIAPGYARWTDEAKRNLFQSLSRVSPRLAMMASMVLEPTGFKGHPETQKFLEPPNTFAGKFGRGAEQAGEELAVGALAPEIEGAGALRRAGRMALGAGQGAALGVAQTGDWRAAGPGAALGAGGSLIGEFARLRAPKYAEKELFPEGLKLKGATPAEAEAAKTARREAAERYVGQRGMRPATAAGLEQEIAANAAKIQHLTEAHPVYSARTIPIEDVLAPVRQRIDALKAAGEAKAAKELEIKAAQWAKDLGFEEPVAGKQVEMLTKGPRGETLYNTVEGKPGQTMTTAAKVNEWARGLAKQKGAEEGTAAARSATTKLIPEERAVIENAVRETERDSFLKDALLTLSQKKGSEWTKKLGYGVAGEFGVDALREVIEALGESATGKKTHVPSSAITKAKVAVGIATFLAYSRKNPGAMTRLMLALRTEGAVLPPALEALGRQGMREVAKEEGEGGEAESPRTTSEQPTAPREAKPTPFKAMSFTPEMTDAFQQAGLTYHIRPSLLMGMAQAESAGNPQAVSPKGARGLMQFMPETAREMNLDPTKPVDSIWAAARKMRKLLDDNGGDERLALAAYNAGQGRVKGSVPKNRETPAYVNRVLAFSAPGA